MFARMILAALVAAAALAQPAPSVFEQVHEMVTALSDITGWTVRRAVPAEMLSKDTFRRYVDKRMKETSSAADVRAEETTLKMFGFVPRDFDLTKETVDLVSEQAAAFYDYNKKRLFIIDSTSEGEEQRVALVHELAHALADQHHPLGKYLHKGSPDDDASTARQAVMEGQATWLTWAYMSKRNGGKAEVPDALIDELTKSVGGDGAEFPVFAKAPLYMKESLVFPYNEGLKFQNAVFHKIGRPGFDQVFTRPPTTTQQILHPDAYLENKPHTEPDPPALASVLGKKEGRHYRILAEGSLGEFDHSVLLRQFVGDKAGAAAAAHWSGGTFRLYEFKPDKHPVLSYRSDWDSPESARRFFDLYQRLMKGPWTKMTVEQKEKDKLTGTGDTGKFQLWITGSSVQSVEGLR